MDALLFEKFVPGAVFTASLLGSAHCVGMCGPLAGAYAKGAPAAMGYHLGRLAAYLMLGALAGLVGAQVLTAEKITWLSWAAALGIAYVFVAMGMRLLRGQGVHLPGGFKFPFMYRLHEFARGNAFLGGTLSAFLPCGWLHVFVLGAATLASPWQGAGVLLAFWAGTLPAFASLSALRHWVLGPFAARAPRLAGVLLIAVGLAVVAMRVNAGLPNSVRAPGATEHSEPAHHCH